MSIRLQFALALVVMLGDAVYAQPGPASSLTVQQAVTIALEKNPWRKAALAETSATSAGVKSARSLLLPRLTFSETATRENDPVYVFGSKLRQQRFSEADFALNKLNTPLPFGNFSTRFTATWNLFDSFASWHGVARARLIKDAAGHQLSRTEQEIMFRVIRSYFQALLAAKRLQVADQSVTTAQAIVDRSQARFDSGLAVEADLLSAKVRLAARRQELIRARNDLELARAQLNSEMGVPVESVFELNEVQPKQFPLPPLEELESTALANRPDFKRASAEEAAQRQSVAMAKASFGPQVNAIAGWELDNPTFLAGGGGNNWLAGIEVKLDLFQGGAKRAELSRQRALEEKASALKQAAADMVRLEVRRAHFETEASRQQIEVAQAAIAQARESLRIHQDRYESGLTTMTDLLSAEDDTRRSQTDYWEAIYHFQISYANLELAIGSLNLQSPVVMP